MVQSAEEKKAKQRAWWLANRDKLNERVRQRRLANPEKYREKDRQRPSRAASSRAKRKANPERYREYDRRKRQKMLAADPTALKKKQAKYYADNRERLRAQQAEYAKKRTATIPNQLREKRRAYHQKRYVEDIRYRIQFNCRVRVRTAFHNASVTKTCKATKLIGCTGAELVAHLVSLFADGMTLDNYGDGPDQWVIDHVRPCDAFDLTDPVQQRECFHYTNLQPLWSKDNLSKGSRLDWMPEYARPKSAAVRRKHKQLTLF